jgi:hypothetical protein
MRELPILTTELTLQLERCVMPKETAPGEVSGATVVRFGRTIASKQNSPWPPSGVFGFNGDDVDRLDEILAFFGDIRPIFYLVQGGFGPAVGKALADAGYYLHDWKQTILYGLPATEPAKLPADVTIELVTDDTIDAAAEVAAEGNQWPPQWREGAMNGVRQSLHREHFQLFLARYQGQPAGIGNLSRSGASDSWCGLGGAAVIPALCRRGIHTALLQHRLHIAFELEYQLVVSGADFGSTSFRNQQRAGLRLAYIETAWKKREL